MGRVWGLLTTSCTVPRWPRLGIQAIRWNAALYQCLVNMVLLDHIKNLNHAYVWREVNTGSPCS